VSRTRGSASNLHRRLTVVWLDAEARSRTVAALADDVVVVDRRTLDDLAGPVAAARREAEQATDDALGAEIEELAHRKEAAERDLHRVVAEVQRLRESAQWCEQQPAAEAAAEAQLASLVDEIAEHSRTVREATRRLERVLEQRAAADSALEDARRELIGLGATGIDETDVRRGMEEASEELRSATAEYQDAMKEVSRRRAALAGLEREVAESGTAEEAAPEIPLGDQFQAMGQVLRAKFGTGDGPAPATGPGDADLDRARDDVRSAQERAEEAQERLSAVRRRIDGFETELHARIDGGDARDARHRAAVALEAQVSAVERQLAEAEAAVRAEVDDATRALTGAERALDRLRREGRERRQRLADLAVLVLSSPAQDTGEVDLVAHAPALASAIREHLTSVEADLRRAGQLDDALGTEHADKESELALRRAGRHDLLSEDRREALSRFLADRTGTVVLDDVVSLHDLNELLVADLDALDPHGPLVVLTEDHGVAGWAIELPHERGRLANAAEIRSLAAVQEPAPSAVR
jgi:chromosome segregation ATPase